MTKGLFITIEGVEGAGKSTCIDHIAAYFEKKKLPVVVTREPGGSVLGEKLRAILLEESREPLCPNSELLMIFAARAQHLQQVIYPALQAKKIVVCDRFTDATYAYQGEGRQLGYERVSILETFVQQTFRPQLTLVLDVPVKIGMKRVQNRGLGQDRFEKEDLFFFETVRQSYLARAKAEPERYGVIDASQSLLRVSQAITELLDSKLKHKE